VSTRTVPDERALPTGDAKRSAVTSMFDRVAPQYDRMNRVISLGLDRRWRHEAIDALRLPAGSLVLDLACGTGDLMRELERVHCAAIGIDLSEQMLAAARVDAPLVRGDAERAPFPDAAFDGVVCGFAFRNFVELPPVLAECARVMRTGGRIVVLDAAVPDNPVLRAGNAIWFRGAVPLLGRLLTRAGDAYGYLPRSTAYLPAPEHLLAAFEEAGFVDVARRTMTGGSVQLVTGTRR
jgi:demethylmenaquinone methyltransferase / 2-methoxy-6-polyprenyl-1,4-benzoquinol methylase